jgi:hypothetical protein
MEGHRVDYYFLNGIGQDSQLSIKDGVTPKYENNKITYESIIDGVNLRNIVFNDSVKEDIILTKYNRLNAFKFKILTDLTAKIDENKAVKFLDNNDKEIFSLPAPNMSDPNIDEGSGEA